jgi:hypothetical protein
MASRPTHLKAVPAAITLTQLVEAMGDLRQTITDVFLDATAVTLTLGPDLASFDVAIYLPPLADPARTEFLLDLNPLQDSGIVFSKVHTKVLERSCRRRVVMATITTPSIQGVGQ